jgi:L-gulonolactone oxidase
MTHRRWVNWSATQSCDAAAIHEPRSREELIVLMKTLSARGDRVKVVGAGHSFSDIACSESAHLISLRRLDSIGAIDPVRCTVSVEAGCSLEALENTLREHSLALPSSCSIAEPTLGGMISTGTHGTGLRHRSYASAVRELEVVTAEGDCFRISDIENASYLPAARLSLGALGVITALTFDCVPAFRVEAHYQPQPFETVLECLANRAGENEFFSFWWLPGTPLSQTMIARRVEEAMEHKARRAGSSASDALLRASSRISGAAGPVAAAAVRMVVSSRFARDRRCTGWSDEVFHSTIRLKKRVLEHAIPVSHAAAALREIDRWSTRSGPPDRLPVEVRFGAADDLWLSMSYGRDVCYIGVMMTAVAAPATVERYFRSIESILADYDSRPHWGKITYRESRDLVKSYPHWDDFAAVRAELDPNDMFGNSFLDRVLGTRQASFSWP